MTNTASIFIFTKDRPATLNKTLASIQTISYSKYVIDDSASSDNQEGVSKLCKQYSNCNYLGKEQFQKFVSENKIESSKFNFLLRELGSTEWNLGYARNFALLYSKSIHANIQAREVNQVQCHLPICQHHHSCVGYDKQYL